MPEFHFVYTVYISFKQSVNLANPTLDKPIKKISEFSKWWDGATNEEKVIKFQLWKSIHN